LSQVKHLTDDTFDTLISTSEVPVLVDFWAEWCGPCRMMSPVLDEAAKEMGDKIVIAKLNVDENPATATKFSIMTIPTMILFKQAKPIGKIIGFVPKAQLKKKIEDAIA